MYSGDGKNRNHSGEGHLVSNIVTFVILFAIFAAGFYATSFAELGSALHAWLPMAGIIGGAVIAFGVGVAINRRTSHHPDREANEAAQSAQVDAEYSAALRSSARH